LKPLEIYLVRKKSGLEQEQFEAQYAALKASIERLETAGVTDESVSWPVA
jgi:exonuclease VII small subunit